MVLDSSESLRTDALGTAFSFPLFHQIAHFLAGVRVLSSEVVGNVTYKVVPGNALKKISTPCNPLFTCLCNKCQLSKCSSVTLKGCVILSMLEEAFYIQVQVET